MAKMPYGRNLKSTKKVKGMKNGRVETYEIKVWTNSFDTSNPKLDYYSITWQIEGSWSLNGGYGKEVKTGIKTLSVANKAATALAGKIRKGKDPFY